jgi:thiol-disulfide isomerase/thioredoxin
MRFKNTLMALFILTFTLSFFGCDQKELKEEDLIPKQNRDLEYTFFLKSTNKESATLTINSKTLKIKEENLKGKVILLNFWATWCDPCKAEIPHLVNLRNKYKDKLEIIGILIEQKDPKALTDFMDKYHITYPVMLGAENFKISSFYGVRGIPYMVLYDNKGNFITDYTGPVPEEMIDQDISKSLQ